MAAFWDNWFVPGLTTLGLHGFVVYLILSGLEITANDIIPTPMPDYVKASLVEKPQAKPVKTPMQPIAPPKPAVEQLAVPKSLPTVGDYVDLQQVEVNADNPLNTVETETNASLDALMRAIDEEEQVLKEDSDNTEVQRYTAYIKQAIESSWSRPLSARNGMEVRLAIILVPTGEVVDANVIQSSGNDAFDRSAINAVKQVGRFSKLAKLEPRLFEEYFRELNLLFHPEDLLL